MHGRLAVGLGGPQARGSLGGWALVARMRRNPRLVTCLLLRLTCAGATLISIVVGIPLLKSKVKRDLEAEER